MYGILDIPWFTSADDLPTFDATKLIAEVTPAPVKSEDFWTIRNKQRMSFFNTMPVVREAIALTKIAQEYYDFWKRLEHSFDAYFSYPFENWHIYWIWQRLSYNFF